MVFSEEEKQNQVTIKHTYDFSFRTESAKYTAYVVREFPGCYKTDDQTEIDNPGGLLEFIPAWCDNIRADPTWFATIA